MYKFNYEDLRLMPMEEMLNKSSVYEIFQLIDTKLSEIPISGRGVYVLYSLTGKALYVGKSECLRKRIRCHLKGQEKITENYIPFVGFVRTIYVSEEVGRHNLFSVERWFISQLKPEFNIL